MIDKDMVVLIQGWLDQHPQEIYWDHNEELNDEHVSMIMAGGICDVEEELYDSNIEYIDELEQGALRDAIDRFGLSPTNKCWSCTNEDCDSCEYYERDDGEDMAELIDELRELVSASVDINIKSLIRNTRKYLALSLPVEHNAYWQDYMDVKEELEYWGINPIELKQYYPTVRWYNCPSRKTPLMGAGDIAEAWNNCNYSGYWHAMLDCRETLALSINGKLKGKMVLKKGARVVIHDYWNGASAIDQFTLADHIVDVDGNVFNDGANHYGIQRCCGYINDAWESILEEK